MKIDKGPFEYLRALATGDPEQIREALEFQRESFKAQFGCYPEECKVVLHGSPEDTYGKCEDSCEICKTGKWSDELG